MGIALFREKPATAASGKETGRSGSPIRILVVDDDPEVRGLLRESLEVADVEVEESDSAMSAAELIALARPDVLVLDLGLPGLDGLARLLGDPLAEGRRLDLCGEDLRRLVELERGQRMLLQSAYRDTVAALARALESKDSGTGAHSHRVQRYAMELTEAVAPELVGDTSMEYGFLLHDVGKIGIPDSVLRKPAPLSIAERKLMETHTVLGEQMLDDLALLRGEGLKIVRSHHERWDGSGYPDRLGGEEIPLGARIFAVADSLDAMTNDRPYRAAGRWEDAADRIVRQASRQFDPDVVEAFREREPALRSLHYELAGAAGDLMH
jgi:ribonuclease P protein subunit RPR2